MLLRNTHDCGGIKIRAMGLLAAPVLRDLHPTCTDHTLMSGQPVLHTGHFLAIPSARPAVSILQKIAHVLVLGVSRNTNNCPAYQHEPRAPIGFKLTGPVWRLCDRAP